MAGIKPLEGVERFLAVLTAMNVQPGMTVSDVSRMVGIPRAAVNRYIVTLVELGYVFRDERTKAYRVTSKVLELSRGIAAEQRIREAIRPAMVETCAEIGWPMTFTTIRNARVALIAHTDARSPFTEKPREQSVTSPLVGRSAGHVLLAFRSPSVSADLLKVALEDDPGLYSRADITAGQFPAELERVRQQRFAGTFLTGVERGAIAVPVLTRDEDPFALSAGFLGNMLDLPAAQDRFLGPLRACAARIEKAITDFGPEA